MKTITQSLIMMGRSSASLTDEQNDGLAAALAPMGIDPHDCTGATLTGMTPDDMLRVGTALLDNADAVSIIVASETDGTRIGVVDNVLRLLPQD